jgi:hypothetical protein
LKITGKNEEVQAAPEINIANHNWDLINDLMKEMSTSFCFVSLPSLPAQKKFCQQQWFTLCHLVCQLNNGLSMLNKHFLQAIN